MKFGLFTEGDTNRGYSVTQRYGEMIREAQYAEEVGFDTWGCSEQHFIGPSCTIAAPEVLYGAVAHATSRITLRTMSTVMLHFNHPIRIAERLATIDVLSHGRLELAAVRGNNARTLDAFEVNPLTTVKEWDETLRVVVKALTQETLEHQGDFYTIAPVKVWPRLCQPTFPRTYVSSTGIGTHEHAGSLGLGVQSFTIYGWDHVEEAVRAHQKAVANPHPIPGVPVNKSIARLVIGGQIAATKKEALELARPSALGFMKWLIGIFDETGVKGPDFAYMHDWKKLIAGHEDDIEWMNDNLPQVLNGTPDDIIEGVKRFETMGFDEVIFRLDGQGHRQIMKALEYFGKYVIPEFRNPHDVVQHSDYEALGIFPPKYML
jgi:alkanesulfonate monooxygenase SsuD/methylene tetrahydromethanopterin reductase-like flavin-dependent oxidoreductase (luciferase family)